MKTVIYTVEITDVLTDDQYNNWLPRKVDGSLDEQQLAQNAKDQLDVDDIVITRVQVFDGE